jgi:hypothetical protein
MDGQFRERKVSYGKQRQLMEVGRFNQRVLSGTTRHDPGILECTRPAGPATGRIMRNGDGKEPDRKQVEIWQRTVSSFQEIFRPTAFSFQDGSTCTTRSVRVGRSGILAVWVERARKATSGHGVAITRVCYVVDKKRRGGEMSLVGFGFLAGLLLELGLCIARNVLVRVGVSMEGGLRTSSCCLASICYRERSWACGRIYRAVRSTRTSFLNFASCSSSCWRVYWST